MDSLQAELIVVGAGPGGYAAAFYAADKGKKVILVEQAEQLGGVCLSDGCIPSKALLHVARLIDEASESKSRGIHFGTPKIDLDQLRAWKNSVVKKLSKGIGALAEKRGVHVLRGRGYFEDSRTLKVETEQGRQLIHYDKAIIAVGSKPAIPAAFNLGNKRIMTSTEALELEEVPKDLLVVGGGYIGLELGTVYAALGSQVVLVEALDSILTGVDSDLVRRVRDKAEKIFKGLRVHTKVLKLAASGKQIKVVMEAEGKKKEEFYDRVLVSVGRIPNCDGLGLENTKVTRDEKGFICVNSKQETRDPAIYAVGDVAGGALLAHKASREARVAVDVWIGESSTFDYVIPSIVFTDPEVAWCGLTEIEARERGIPVTVARFPWAASGRAVSSDRSDGLTKLIIDPDTERILGVGIVGVGAGELISEGVVAMEMEATAKDLAESIHPHPTLSETLMECAEMFYGYSTHASVRRTS